MEIWTDQEISPGQLWHQEIENRLGTAQVAVLLVTPSFLSSSYASSHELPAVLTAAKSEGLRIFWIPIIASSYKETEIAQFQAAHEPSTGLAGARDVFTESLAGDRWLVKLSSEKSQRILQKV